MAHCSAAERVGNSQLVLLRCFNNYQRFANALPFRMVRKGKRPRIIVATDTSGFGLMRMLQMSGERTRPALKGVYTLDEAFAELGVQSLHFEPLQ